jgi:hypothetical protein
MPISRLIVVVPLLLLSGGLLVLGVIQIAVIFDAIARFGAAEAWPRMAFKALTFALPGLALGVVALIAIRRR